MAVTAQSLTNNNLRRWFCSLTVSRLALLNLLLAVVLLVAAAGMAVLVASPLAIAPALAGFACLLTAIAALRLRQIMLQLHHYLQESQKHPHGAVTARSHDKHVIPVVSQVASILEELNQARADHLQVLGTNRVLAREQQRLLQLLDGLQTAVLLLAPSGLVIAANRASNRYLSCKPGEARGRAILDCLKHASVRALLANGANTNAVHGALTLELGPDQLQDDCTVAVTLNHVFASDTSLEGRVLLFTDVTRRKQIEKAQADFLDSVAHEFYTPLTTLRSSIELLVQGDVADPAQQRQFYNVIEEETARLTRLIDNLLSMSKVETGVALLDKSPTRLRKVLDNCIEVVTPQCQRKQQTLMVDFPDHLPTLDVDKHLLQVAIMNLLGNAVKYTPAGGTITLSTLTTDCDFQFICQDNGPGIASEDLPYIFDKFYRGSSAACREISGSGIGLSTARQIMRAHGGDLLCSSPPDAGSIFTLVLPAALINATIGA